MTALRGTSETADAVVIGGGVVGCSVLRELALMGIDALLVEAQPDIGEGASKANSAILHTGFDAKPGTVEANLLRRSSAVWPDLLDELGVPSLACGALMIARTEDEAARLEGVAATARGHGVAVELVDGAWIRDAAPYVTPDALRALHVPDEGIVDPFWLTRAYAEAAIGLGARVRTRAAVVALAVGRDVVDVTLSDGGRIRAAQAFDCAGLWADDVARLAGDSTFGLTPRKGEFLVSERTAGVDRIVLPIPGPLGKGMLVTPIVFGGVLLGPTADDGHDKSDRSTTAEGRGRILAACRDLVPAVDEMTPIRSFAGVRAVSSTGDYVIRSSSSGDRLTVVAGIRSTGISASPAIGEAAVALAAEVRGWRPRTAARPKPAAPPEIEGDLGDIVCVCRSVGDAEVAAALTSSIRVRTTDALKRRCGVGFGDCQGNRCLAAAVERIAATLGEDAAAIEKGPIGSWLVDRAEDSFTGLPVSPSTGWPSDRTAPVGNDPIRAEVAIVGGGFAAIGAALCLADAGTAVVVVDRGAAPGGALAAIPAQRWTDAEQAARERLARATSDGRVRWLDRSTCVAVEPDAGRWRIEAASPRGDWTIDAGSVLLATGGYARPREHASIDGPRPSGVMTADFVADALDRGWVPARTAVVVGRGRIAEGITERLRAVGVSVVLHAQPIAAVDAGAHPNGRSRGVTAVRGQPRLTAVEIDGRWLDADALVLADRLQPATFLLRGLGIGDERPGIPAPVDGSGALPLPGLWAAGTCVAPDIDHAGSLEAGGAVGAAMLAARSAAAATTVALAEPAVASPGTTGR